MLGKFYFKNLLLLSLIILCIVFGYLLKKNLWPSNVGPNMDDRKIKTLSNKSQLKFYYELKPNLKFKSNLSYLGREFNYSIEYDTNSDGFNQLTEFPLVKTNNSYRIITIGDSFTFGESVNTKDNFPSQLQTLLNKECKNNMRYEIFNLGVFGYDIQYSLERLRLRGIKYDPDLVIWTLIEDDFNRMHEELLPIVKEIIKKSHTEGTYSGFKGQMAIQALMKKVLLDKYEDQDNLYAMQEKRIEEISNYYKGKLVFYAFGKRESKYKEIIKNVTTKRPFTYSYLNGMDLSKDIILPDMHPNSKGHKLIARDIFNFIKKDNIINCK